MPATVIVGMQWGDEGKAKVLDALAAEIDIVVRYQGGANAGHTVVVGQERYAFHLVPSGILHENKVCVIANGCVVDPQQLVKEIEELRGRGIKVDRTNLLLSERAQLVMPYHKLVDQLSEKRKEEHGQKKIGTTGRGIGPAYVDKVARAGIRVVDLLRPDFVKLRVQQRLSELNPLLTAVYKEKELDADTVTREILSYAGALKPLMADTAAYLNKALADGKRLLFEGAQGTLLDVDHGTYPYVTSSNSTAGGAATGSGVSPRKIETALGIVKAYTTRVGAGPFPTEMHGDAGEALRQKGGEFGVTTGRPRRCGWFDAVCVRYAAEVSGVDALALTKIDVLTGEKELKICTGYKLNGETIDRFPADLHAVEHVEPVYATVPGWEESLADIRAFEDLPPAAQAYVLQIEGLVGTPIRYIGVGKARDALIRRG
ncbi:MAG: adenylosuccinate synthase [Planctomycetes bacterium]|nr:adenylosuccinate synthase [Planctomycetota bacterium]